MFGRRIFIRSLHETRRGFNKDRACGLGAAAIGPVFQTASLTSERFRAPASAKRLTATVTKSDSSVLENASYANFKNRSATVPPCQYLEANGRHGPDRAVDDQVDTDKETCGVVKPVSFALPLFLLIYYAYNYVKTAGLFPMSAADRNHQPVRR